MKLRIKGNSIRFRLTQSEVQTFAGEGVIQEVIHFNHQNFLYALEKRSTQQLTASFENGKITVFVPIEIANQWTDSEEISLEGNDGELRLLIEKDFVCLKPRKDEDESDNFPHPNQNQSC